VQIKDRLSRLLIGAGALVAMLIGHAVELAIEDAHLFGDRQAQYHHVGQSFVAELSALLLLAVAVGIIRYVAARARSRDNGVDHLLPALQTIADAGFARLAAQLVSLQLFALILTEVCEQRLSGYQGNALLSIVGPGHASALAVHLLVGAFIAFLVYRFAQFVAARTRVLVNAVIAFVRWATVQPACDLQTNPPDVHSVSVFTRHVSLIALGLAKRPPPVSNTPIA
jgi:hypothetical protein